MYVTNSKRVKIFYHGQKILILTLSKNLKYINMVIRFGDTTKKTEPSRDAWHK